MQMVKKAAAFLLLFWVALIVFMPKEELYYALEKKLAEEGIEINEAEISEGMFSLDLQGVTVYAKGIKIATVAEVSCFTLLFYTSVEVKDIAVDQALSAMVPTKIASVDLTHSILMPMTVRLSAEGDFGMANGIIDLLERKVHIDLDSPDKLGGFKQQLTQGEEGWYYETQY